MSLIHKKVPPRPKLVNAAGRNLRLQILGAFATVFVTFLIRTAWSILNALSYEEDSFSNLIGGCKPCDGSCSSVSVPLFYFLQFTPQLQMSIMLVSSPLTLLVALWGMTGVRALELMAVKRQQLDSLKGEQTLNRKV